MKVSVVVVSYRRLKRLDEILSAWLKETPDVWLCDCSRNGFRSRFPVNIIRASPDPGSKIRHAVALLTDGDLVVKADDDLMPRRGLVKDFIANYKKFGRGIYGIHGRTFHGQDYYSGTKLYGAKSIPKTRAVDFVGVVTCAPRELLPMDLKGCRTEIEDLFWQMRCYPKVKKYVISTNKFLNLRPECKDAQRLCANEQFRKNRRRFYLKWRRLNYKK